MPTAYVLATDKIEQARAILSGEVWHDAHLATILELALERLEELDHDIGCRNPGRRGNVLTFSKSALSNTG